MSQAAADPQGPHLAFADGILTAGNRHLRRSWRLRPDGTLAALALVSGGRSWLRDSAEPAIAPPGGPLAAPVRATWTGLPGAESPVSGPALRGELAITGGDGRHWRLIVTVWAEAPAITCRVVTAGAPEAGPAGSRREGADGQPTGVERDPVAGGTAAPADDLQERLDLDAWHLHLIVADLAAQTDNHDNLAGERRLRLSAIEPVAERTCLAAIEDPRADAGLILLKHAPLPAERPIDVGDDVVVRDRIVRLRGHGCGDTGEGYAWSVVAWHGGRWGRARALHAVQRAVRAPRAGLDGLMISNTWGDRNRDACISDDFVAAEIAAGAALGVDVCQIDDGWMRGTTSNSVRAAAEGGVWEGYWRSDPDFWGMHPQRFPRGMEPTVERCRRAGIGLSLWFGPDSIDDFANWRKDADACLGFWRRWGVRIIKLDGIKARSKRGEANLRRFFDAVLRESGGEVLFDLDITAEVRPGYFGAMDVGQLYVENRYTDWHRWWPHAGLRTLWTLSWYVAPQRVRMEFLNPLRCAEKYGADPLAPACWPPASILASVLPAAPLAFFETSRLPEQVAAAWRPLIALWRQHRAELHGGTVLPIGGEPDGATWTGFCSDGGGHAHVLAFRCGAAAPQARIPLPLAGRDWTASAIAGAGRAQVSDGELAIEMADPLGFLWLRLARG